MLRGYLALWSAAFCALRTTGQNALSVRVEKRVLWIFGAMERGLCALRTTAQDSLSVRVAKRVAWIFGATERGLCALRTTAQYGAGRGPARMFLTPRVER